jgi:hypothetical protein
LRILNVAGRPDEKSSKRRSISAVVVFDAGCHESISGILLDNEAEIYKRAVRTPNFLCDYN